MTREFVNRRSYIGFIFALCLLFSATPLYADGTHPQGIKLDGTIGNAGKLDLPGPDYEIKPEYGKQAGSNLFHSFEQFNIHKGESATFSGSDSVKNIISRVTGGSASWIDGKLASPITQPDLHQFSVLRKPKKIGILSVQEQLWNVQCSVWGLLQPNSKVLC